MSSLKSVPSGVIAEFYLSCHVISLKSVPSGVIAEFYLSCHVSSLKSVPSDVIAEYYTVPFPVLCPVSSLFLVM